MPKSRFNMYVIDLCYSKGQGRLRHFFKEGRSTLWCDRLWRVEEVCVCVGMSYTSVTCALLYGQLVTASLNQLWMENKITPWSGSLVIVIESIRPVSGYMHQAWSERVSNRYHGYSSFRHGPYLSRLSSLYALAHVLPRLPSLLYQLSALARLSSHSYAPHDEHVLAKTKWQHKFISKLIDLIVCLIDCLIDSLVDWLMNWPIHYSDWMID